MAEVIAADGLPIAIGDVVNEYTDGSWPQGPGEYMGTHRVVGIDANSGVLLTDRYADTGLAESPAFPLNVRHAAPGTARGRMAPGGFIRASERKRCAR